MTLKNQDLKEHASIFSLTYGILPLESAEKKDKIWDLSGPFVSLARAEVLISPSVPVVARNRYLRG